MKPDETIRDRSGYKLQGRNEWNIESTSLWNYFASKQTLMKSFVKVLHQGTVEAQFNINLGIGWFLMVQSSSSWYKNSMERFKTILLVVISLVAPLHLSIC